LFDYVAPFALNRLPHRSDPRSVRRALVAAMIVAIVPTNLYLWAWRFVDLNRHGYPYYLYREEVSALEWIEANAKPGDVVLSSLTIGQYVPMLTGAHAYLGHWAQTLDFFGKSQAVGRFFDRSTPEDERRAIVAAHGIDFVFVGPAERELGAYDPGRSSQFKMVHSTPLVSIYATMSGG
jgi:hypothetical protein